MKKKEFVIIILMILAVLYFTWKSPQQIISQIKNIVPAPQETAAVEKTDNSKDTAEAEEDSDLILHGPYTVTHVVDGDTCDIDLDGTTTRLRFIGIDTPESVNPDETKNCEEGRQASAFTKAMLTNKEIWIEYDIEKEDKYGRTLAYIYLDENGDTMLNRILVQQGYASTLTIQPNCKYASVFAADQKQARKDKAGFWSEDFFPEE